MLREPVFRRVEKFGATDAAKLRARVAGELKTTFASRYTTTLSLAGVLDLGAIANYAKQATGEKALVVPSRR